MNFPMRQPIKDIRDFMSQYGTQALQRVPGREWVPDALCCVNRDSNGPVTAAIDRSIRCLHFTEIGASNEGNDLIDGLLTSDGLSMVYGASNTGKSFFALDVASHIASGREYRKMSVQAGAVVYVTLEGHRSFQFRLNALLKANKLSANAPFFVVRSPINLLEKCDVTNLVTAIKDAVVNCQQSLRLIIIDTLSRAMPGADESRSLDMTSAIQSVDLIRETTRAHAMLVHHSGKDESRGARGHTSLRAAIDTEIEISRAGEDILQARVTKQRDLLSVGPMAFRLVPHVVALNPRGKEITSCTVEHEMDPALVSARESGKRQSRLSRATLRDEDVLAILGRESMGKTILVQQLREKLKAPDRDANATVSRLIDEKKIREFKKLGSRSLLVQWVFSPEG